MQKQELTKLIDHDGDELIDEYALPSPTIGKLRPISMNSVSGWPTKHPTSMPPLLLASYPVELVRQTNPEAGVNVSAFIGKPVHWT